MKRDDILERHQLTDGRIIWIQRTKIPGVRKPSLSVVICPVEPLEAPEITDHKSMDSALRQIADMLRDDVLELA